MVSQKGDGEEVTYEAPPKLSAMSSAVHRSQGDASRFESEMSKKLSRGLDDVREELNDLRAKVTRLNTIVTPLMSITDLSLAKKRIDQSQSSVSTGPIAVNMLTAEERLRELEKMNP